MPEQPLLDRQAPRALHVSHPGGNPTDFSPGGMPRVERPIIRAKSRL